MLKTPLLHVPTAGRGATMSRLAGIQSHSYSFHNTTWPLIATYFPFKMSGHFYPAQTKRENNVLEHYVGIRASVANVAHSSLFHFVFCEGREKRMRHKSDKRLVLFLRQPLRCSRSWHVFSPTQQASHVSGAQLFMNQAVFTCPSLALFVEIPIEIRKWLRVLFFFFSNGPNRQSVLFLG